MSVYIHTTSHGVYFYDFRVAGVRFTGSTKQTTRREAEKVEAEIQEQAKQAHKTDKDSFGKRLTFDEAANRWWTEVGQYRADNVRYLDYIGWLQDRIGGKTVITKITDSLVARLVAERRAQVDARFRDKRRRKPIGPATVNRTMVVPLRQIILRAKNVWRVEAPDVKWNQHLLAEPQLRVREASVAEESAIIVGMSRGYDDAVRFLFETGCRKMEVIGLRWTDVDFFNRQVSVLGKGNRRRAIPMSDICHSVVWAQQGKHPEFVFTYTPAFTRHIRGVKRIKGHHYPLTSEGLASMMKRVVRNAGVVDFHLHDIRHTTASRVTRQSNLAVTKELLGHSDIRTTMRYVHTSQEDVRRALNAMKAEVAPAFNPPVLVPMDAAKRQK